MTRLAELKEKQKALKEEMLAESKAAFKDISASLFSKYPKLESFSWHQYTPYFNDGDECVFSARTDYIDVGWGGKEIEELSDFTFKYEHGDQDIKNDSELKGFNEEVRALFKDLDNDMLKEMFGDHVRVVARRDTIVIEEYEHD